MARQKSLFKMQGTLGDVTFYKSGDGYLAREKADNGAKFKSNPAFQRTRENAAEFGRAAKAGKALRYAFRRVLQQTADSRMSSRLHKELMRVLQEDTQGSRGQRTVKQGNLQLLQGFEFNVYSSFNSTAHMPFTSVVDRSTGNYAIDIPVFELQTMIAAPDGATHFKLISAAAAINFEEGNHTAVQMETDAIALKAGNSNAISLGNTLPSNSPDPIFLVLGIAFYQKVNDTVYSLKNGAFNALTMAKVLGA